MNRNGVGIFRVPLTETVMLGTVSVPVASIMADSACLSSHRMVSPSDLCPNSHVNWKILTAQVAGKWILQPCGSPAGSGRLARCTSIWLSGSTRSCPSTPLSPPLSSVKTHLPKSGSILERERENIDINIERERGF
ncbi:hypothetical protein U1Q18_014908 [Sarracenia purpurea var. burkii]